ncbi:MAG: DNA polymerase III subunit alpha [Phycisphaerae bacterium]|nr:DNA polymerase III subunit alpha [Phycisphaerae bacterium]
MGGNGERVLAAALGVHSHFSILCGTRSPADLIAQAVAGGYSALHLADVDGMYGAVGFYRAARDAGLKAILGVELHGGEGTEHCRLQISDCRLEEGTPAASSMVDLQFSICNLKSPRGRRLTGDPVPRRGDAPSSPPGRLILVAATREGYRNCCRLTSRRRLTPETFDLLADVATHRDGLIVLCDRPDWLKPLTDAMPTGQLYAALSPGDGPEHRQRLRRLFMAARDAAVPLAATLDSYFASPADHDLHRVATDIRLLPSAHPPREEDYQPAERHFRPSADMVAFFARCPEALANANAIAAACEDDVVELGVFHFPVSRVPRGQTAFSHLHRLCERGLRRRYRPVQPEAVTRLARELAVIEKLGFADYFLFVNEIVAFSRGRGIPVDVRGSAAGSLVAYVLGFTQVCPIAHDLYFERFLHEGRTDCPDIDIDLCWRRRDEVIDFCYHRWGGERVAMICTHNTSRARGAFGEVAKVMGLTATQAHSLSRHIPEGIAAYLQRDWRELAEARRNLPLDDPHFRAVLAMAARLEGAPRNLGIHCGGLVIAPRPLTDYLPLQRAAKGIVVTQYEMNAVEAIGLVKMDLLGNRALSEVAEAGRAMSKGECRMSSAKAAVSRSVRHSGGEFDHSTFDIRHSTLDDLDPADPATAALVASGDTLGVFQAESPGMRHLCRQLRVASREELTVALSVIRPGPAGVGMKTAYIRRHLGQEAAAYLHPRLQRLLGRTHGVMLYQEDTMRVAEGLAGFTPAEADMLRKAVSKKRSPERMAALRRRFLAKAAAHTPDLAPESADAIWEQIARFASYSFCRAHACVYGRIAWQTAWLKARHAAAFYTAVFNNHMGMYPMRVHVADAIRHGLRVLPPHVNRSSAESTLEGNGAIRLGLRFARGLGVGTIERIVAGRPYRDLCRLRTRARPAETELEGLIRCGACDGLGANRRAMLAEMTLESPVGELLAGDFRLQISDCRLEEAAVGASSIANQKSSICNHQSPDPRFPWARPFTPVERLQAEIDVLGLFVSGHPMELATGDWVEAASLERRVGQRVAVAGILDATRTVQTSRGRLMRFVTLEDATGTVECTLFPEAYRRFGHLFYHVGPFRVEGRAEDERGAVTLNVQQAESLVDAIPISWAAEEEDWPLRR